MSTVENPYAGQGAVLLDIGGEVGALVVTMPAETEDLEVEIRPAGAPPVGHHQQHGHPHDHDHDAGRPASGYPHVGVVGRPTPGGVQFSLVYPSVVAGDYELCPIPGDRVALSVTVVGGSVTEVDWPADPRG